MLDRVLAGAAALGIATMMATTAVAAPLVTDFYTRLSGPEILNVPFTAPRFDTDLQYSGFVEVFVSGTGFSNGPALNDAFYDVATGLPNPEFYQLNIGWTGANLVPFVGDTRNIDNFIVFIEDLGSVAPPARADYDPAHTYRFVVQIPDAVGLTNLQFGVSDGDFTDNGGNYTIEIFQLAANTVPAPATLALSLTALAALGFARRRA